MIGETGPLRATIVAPAVRGRRTRTPGGDALRRLAANKMGVVGGGIVLFFIFLALFGGALAPQDALLQDLNRIAEPPSAQNWFGTDELGRDFFSRILAGARTALLVAALVTLISAAIGTVVGLISAYTGGLADGILMRIADVLLAAFLNATLRSPVEERLKGLSTLAGIAVFGSKEVIDFIVVFGGLAIVGWSGYARLIRSQVLSLREREFVEAARAIGAPARTILFRHILPNSIAPIIIAVSVNFGNAILAESALSYLGVGVQPPTPSWGQMINANLDQWR